MWRQWGCKRCRCPVEVCRRPGGATTNENTMHQQKRAKPMHFASRPHREKHTTQHVKSQEEGRQTIANTCQRTHPTKQQCKTHKTKQPRQTLNTEPHLTDRRQGKISNQTKCRHSFLDAPSSIAATSQCDHTRNHTHTHTHTHTYTHTHKHKHKHKHKQTHTHTHTCPSPN